MKKLVTIAILPVGLAVLTTLIFPLPALALDILLAVDILFALVSLIVVLRTRKTVDFLLLPTLVFESGIFNAAVFIAFVKILNRGAEFDGRLIRFASFLFVSSGGIIFLVIFLVMVSVILILFIIMAASVIIRVIVIAKRATRVAARFNLVSIKKSGFFSSLGSFVKFLSADGKLYLLIIGAIIGGFLINALLNVKLDDTAIITYPLVFGSGILFMLPYLLVFMAVCIAIVSKAVEAVKPKEGAEVSPAAPYEPPLLLELGYGLIPLVDHKGAELLELIQSIRRESARDLGLVIPSIRIVDNTRLEPSEYCFRINGVDVGRGRIRMEVDPPAIIATHLTEIIKCHAAEIQDLPEM